MNVYEAMRVVRNEFVPHTIDAHLAMDEIEDVVDAYAELAPDWDKLSNGDAEWYIIEPNGDAYWCPYEPTMKGYTWTNDDTVLYEHVALPLGIDWRLCKWQRPEVMP